MPPILPPSSERREAFAYGAQVAEPLRRRPRAAATLVRALKDATGLPIHFHTHDTSGLAAASVLLLAVFLLAVLTRTRGNDFGNQWNWRIG